MFFTFYSPVPTISFYLLVLPSDYFHLFFLFSIYNFYRRLFSLFFPTSQLALSLSLSLSLSHLSNFIFLSLSLSLSFLHHSPCLSLSSITLSLSHSFCFSLSSITLSLSIFYFCYPSLLFTVIIISNPRNSFYSVLLLLFHSLTLSLPQKILVSL